MDKIEELEHRLSQAQGANVGLLAIVISLYVALAQTIEGDRGEAIATVRKGLDDSIAQLSSVDERAKEDNTAMVRAQLTKLIDQAEDAVREILNVTPSDGPTRH